MNIYNENIEELKSQLPEFKSLVVKTEQTISDKGDKEKVSAVVTLKTGTIFRISNIGVNLNTSILVLDSDRNAISKHIKKYNHTNLFLMLSNASY